MTHITPDMRKVTISDTEFTLETAYGSVKSAPDDRDIDDIIRDAKDEKASSETSTTTKTSTKSPTSKSNTYTATVQPPPSGDPHLIPPPEGDPHLIPAPSGGG